MLSFHLVLEDTVLTATRQSITDDKGWTTGEVKWVGTSTDTITNKVQSFSWDDEQTSAVMYLIFNNEMHVGDAIYDRMYAMAETAVKGFPNECRPIP